MSLLEPDQEQKLLGLIAEIGGVMFPGSEESNIADAVLKAAEHARRQVENGEMSITAARIYVSNIANMATTYYAMKRHADAYEVRVKFLNILSMFREIINAKVGFDLIPADFKFA